MEAAAGASHDHWLCTWLSGGSTLPILPHGQPYARGRPCILHILPAGRADPLPGKPDREIVVVMIPFGANGSPGTRGLAGDAQRRATALAVAVLCLIMGSRVPHPGGHAFCIRPRPARGRGPATSP